MRHLLTVLAFTFIVNQVKGKGNSTSRFVVSKQVQPTTHTSVLSMIITGGKNSPTPPRSDIYSAAYAPARDQGFVDRSEDMIIEQIPPIMFVRPMAVVGNTSQGEMSNQSNLTVHSATSSRDKTTHQSNIVIQAGTIPSARYTVDVDNIEFGSIQGKAVKSDKSVFSSLRKTSLQITPGSKKNDFEYERLESYASETNIDGTLTRNLSGRKSGKSDETQSHDNLYESSVTVTSSLVPDSVDNSLFSLTGEASQTACSQEVLSASNDSFSLFNISSGTPEGAIYLEFQNEQPESSPDVLYAKVNKSQKQKQKTFQDKAVDINVTQSEDGFEMVDTKYTVTCTAQLKDRVDSDDAVEETILDMGESAMSLEDTIKAFENFADVRLESEPKSVDFTESQTERSENVIEYQPVQLTKRKAGTRGDKSEPVTDVHVTDETQTLIGETQNTLKSSQTRTVVTSSERQTSNQANVSSFTLTTIGTTSETNGNVLDKNLLEEELDKSVNALLVGIDVDTARWTAVKDKSVSSDSDSDVWEVYISSPTAWS